MNDTRDQLWTGRALNELRTVVSRDAARMARHLEAHARMHDPRKLLCALAARRLLPLQSTVMRPLARPGDCVEAQAFHQLSGPDRQVLWSGGAAVGLPADTREHLASALLRLTWNAQAARRSPGTPPV